MLLLFAPELELLGMGALLVLPLLLLLSGVMLVLPPLLLDGGAGGVLFPFGSAGKTLGFLPFLVVIMCAFLLDDARDDAVVIFLSFKQPVKQSASSGKNQ